MRKEGLRRRGEGKVVRNTPTLPVNELGAQNAYNHIKMGQNILWSCPFKICKISL